MSALRKSAAVLLAVLLTAFALCGCEFEDNALTAESDTAPTVTSVTAPAGTQPSAAQPAEVKTISAVRSGDEIFFSITADELVGMYNSTFGAEYLTPSARWLPETVSGCAHFGGDVECLRFTEDPEVWTLPSVTLYTRGTGGRLMEIAVDYDDHSSSEGMYELFHEIGMTMMRVFLPETDEQSLEELFHKAFIETDELICETDFLDSTAPQVLYRSGCVGFYPYFAYGECIRFCFIPLDDERVSALAAEGVRITEI